MHSLAGMATILNDNELKKLLGVVITNGDPSSIRPNSYVLRLGDEGEFLNAAKEFTLGKTKKGIRLRPDTRLLLLHWKRLIFVRSR